jgi:hypothetical protein
MASKFSLCFDDVEETMVSNTFWGVIEFNGFEYTFDCTVKMPEWLLDADDVDDLRLQGHEDCWVKFASSDTDYENPEDVSYASLPQEVKDWFEVFVFEKIGYREAPGYAEVTL